MTPTKQFRIPSKTKELFKDIGHIQKRFYVSGCDQLH